MECFRERFIRAETPSKSHSKILTQKSDAQTERG